MKTKTVLVRCPAFGAQRAPINLALISSYLNKHGYKTKSFDFNIELHSQLSPEDQIKYWSMESYMFWTGPSLKEIVTDEVLAHWVKTVLSEDPDVVGFSIYSTSYHPTLALSEELKKAKPDIKIVFGGPFLRFEEGGHVYDAIDKRDVDAVVLGEGEETFFELVETLEKHGEFKPCDGAVVKVDGKAVQGEPRTARKDLNDPVYPNYDDFDLSLYNEPILPILCSRSCIYNCAFCNERTYWGKFRTRSGQNVFDEMIYQSDKYGITEFFFCDLAMNGNLKVIEELADLIIASGRKFRWGGYFLCRKMKRDLVFKLAQAGLAYHCIGIETGSPDMLKKMNKNFTIDTAEELLKNFSDAGIFSHTAWIVGYPGETDENFQETLDFIDRNREFIGQVNPASPLNIIPGSPIAMNPEKYNIQSIERPDIWTDGYMNNEIKNKRIDYFNKHYATPRHHRV